MMHFRLRFALSCAHHLHFDKIAPHFAPTRSRQVFAALSELALFVCLPARLSERQPIQLAKRCRLILAVQAAAQLPESHSGFDRRGSESNLIFARVKNDADGAPNARLPLPLPYGVIGDRGLRNVRTQNKILGCHASSAESAATRTRCRRWSHQRVHGVLALAGRACQGRHIAPSACCSSGNLAPMTNGPDVRLRGQFPTRYPIISAGVERPLCVSTERQARVICPRALTLARMVNDAKEWVRRRTVQGDTAPEARRPGCGPPPARTVPW